MPISLTDIISKAVASQTGGIEIPANVKQVVMNGLSESILGGLTQTAAAPGGLDGIKELLTGKSTKAAGPIAEIAGKIFSNGAAKKAGLSAILTGALTKKLPNIIGALGGVLKDQDGDGDVDLQDVLLALKGGKGSAAGSLLGAAATSVLGGLLKKK